MIFATFFAQAVAWNNRRKRTQKVQRELETYTDRQLHDLGIPPSDIRKFARACVK